MVTKRARNIVRVVFTDLPQILHGKLFKPFLLKLKTCILGYLTMQIKRNKIFEITKLIRKYKIVFL